MELNENYDKIQNAYHTCNSILTDWRIRYKGNYKPASHFFRVENAIRDLSVIELIQVQAELVAHGISHDLRCITKMDKNQLEEMLQIIQIEIDYLIGNLTDEEKNKLPDQLLAIMQEEQQILNQNDEILNKLTSIIYKEERKIGFLLKFKILNFERKIEEIKYQQYRHLNRRQDFKYRKIILEGHKSVYNEQLKKLSSLQNTSPNR